MSASMMKPATVTRASDLSAALDNAIDALTSLDADKLEELERMVTASLAEADQRTLFAENGNEREAQLDKIQASHRLLGTLLASTSLNLNVLERLHSRNSIGDATWGTLSNLLDLSRSALRSNQAALSVTANNVANQNVAGYTRQLVNFTADVVTINGETLGAGSHTGLTAVSQRDRVLEQRVQQQTQAQSQSSARQSALNQVTDSLWTDFYDHFGADDDVGQRDRRAVQFVQLACGGSGGCGHTTSGAGGCRGACLGVSIGGKCGRCDECEFFADGGCGCGQGERADGGDRHVEQTDRGRYRRRQMRAGWKISASKRLRNFRSMLVSTRRQPRAMD